MLHCMKYKEAALIMLFDLVEVDMENKSNTFQLTPERKNQMTTNDRSENKLFAYLSNDNNDLLQTKTGHKHQI